VSLSFIKSTVLLTLRYQSWHFPSARGTGTLYVLTHTLSPHRDLLSSEADSKTASYILNTIREEEQQTELLKKASSGKMVNLGAADAVDTKDVAAEQSYNREQVQEQEQVRFCVCLWEVLLLRDGLVDRTVCVGTTASSLSICQLGPPLHSLPCEVLLF
jgi:hypothetical protein